MTTEVYSVRPDQNLGDAAHLMWTHDCDWLPVLDENDGIVAAITDRDIAIAAFHHRLPLYDIPVRIAQSNEVIACGPEEDIRSIKDVMQMYKVRRVPIIDKTSAVLGIISLNDIALACQAGIKGVTAKSVNDTLATIGNRQVTMSKPDMTIA